MKANKECEHKKFKLVKKVDCNTTTRYWVCEKCGAPAYIIKQ